MVINMCRVFLGPLCFVMRYLALSKQWEVVGYIIGSRAEQGKNFYGEALIMARNISKSLEVEFMADPRDILVAHDVAENLNKEVIGVFHTHPFCASVPSRRDVEGMKLWPLVWVIASPIGLDAYLPLKDGKVKKCKLFC